MSESEVIRLPSRFDYSAHRSFVEGYTHYLGNAAVKEVILDFTQVAYLDSSALGMMVLCQKKLSSENKRVKVKGAHGATLDILKMANMQKMFEFI